MITSKKDLIILFICIVSVVAQDISWYDSEKDIFYISTEAQLQGLSELVNNGKTIFDNKTIILNKDITLVEPHTPIGNDPLSIRSFWGIFDGNGYSISNLIVSDVITYAGLFGYVGTNGQIKNLTVNVSKIMTNSSKDKAYSGGLAGFYNSCKPIENCIVNIKDSIVASSLKSAYSGGLVGYIGGLDEITISNSYTTGNIHSVVSSSVNSTTRSGGLVGTADKKITISNSYTNGNVWASTTGAYTSIGTSTSFSGGLIGDSKYDIIILNSYVIGNIFIDSFSNDYFYYSGGLVGHSNMISNITNSYTNAIVHAKSSQYNGAGGIFGLWTNGENNSVYFNSSYADGSTGIGVSSGLPLDISGKTSEELKQKETFIGWDFENIWDIDSKINDGYPYLRNLNVTPTPIKNTQKSDNRYGIRFKESIVSENAEINIILPNNEKSINAEIIIYDMTGNVVFETNTKNSKVSWNLTNTAGRSIANGSYLVIAEAKSISGNIYRYSAKLGVKR